MRRFFSSFELIFEILKIRRIGFDSDLRESGLSFTKIISRVVCLIFHTYKMSGDI